MSVAELHSKGYSAKALASMEANNTIDHKLWQWEIEEGVNHRKYVLGCKTERERERWIKFVQHIARPENGARHL